MGRPNRFKLTGVPQLLTQRGHNRLPCFLDGADYEFFMQSLWDSAEQAGTRIHATVLLPQAYWIMASPSTPDGVGRMVQRIGRCYVRYCNAKYRREGTLWAGRYQACLVEPSPEAMTECAQFLQSTPGRSGVTARGRTWPWTYFDDELPGATDQGLDDDAYDRIAMLVRMGLVIGSESFRRRIAAEAGVRTEPGVRGRPRKSR